MKYNGKKECENWMNLKWICIGKENESYDLSPKKLSLDYLRNNYIKTISETERI